MIATVESPTPIKPLPPVLSIRDALAFGRVSRAYLYGEISSGALKTIKQGRRRFVLASDFLSWLEGKRQAKN